MIKTLFYQMEEFNLKRIRNHKNKKNYPLKKTDLYKPVLFKTFITLFWKFYLNLGKTLNRRLILFGVDPKEESDCQFPCQQGNLLLDKEDLLLRYCMMDYQNQENLNDFVVFFHGAGRNEKQWIDKNGFGYHYQKAFLEQDLSPLPVVSISIGAASLWIDQAPYPFCADLESLFINKIIPYFQKKLDRAGKVHLAGHSLGGFNALRLSLKYPDRFPSVMATSPFLSKLSPYTKSFFYRQIQKYPGYKQWFLFLKMILAYSYHNQTNWNLENPFGLLEKNIPKPYIFLSSSKDDLIAFRENIEAFQSLLIEKKIDHFYTVTDDSHFHPNTSAIFKSFVQKLSKEKRKNKSQTHY
ncbi:MAG: alpha/beta fold hydrolase [Spirochaetes bacterium]|nr:alpha/beta fold hydrolase [Spirochaetota bacterium]